MKDNNEVIKEFNELVNMTASELEKWLKSDDSNSAGWPKETEDGETVGHDSGRKIVEILNDNPNKDPEKYSDDQIAHMRKVVSYCKRHLAQETQGNNEKSEEELKKTKSYASLKNWGHDFLKGEGKSQGSDSKKEDEETKQDDDEEKTGDKRKATEGQSGSNKKQQTQQGKASKKSDDNEEDEDEGDESKAKTRSKTKDEDEDMKDAEENEEDEEYREEEEDEEEEEEDEGDDTKQNKRQTRSSKKSNGQAAKGQANKSNGNAKKDTKKDDDEKDEEGEEEQGQNGSTPKKGPKKGDKVSWNWGGGQPEGKVLDVKGEDTTITTKKGNKVTRKGDPEDPAVVLDAGSSKAIKSAHELN